jgi:biopolymer transport protein ExbD
VAIHLRSDHAAMSEINVTPLVDVMLVLLVIFIVTAPLLIQAVPVELPKTAATRPVAPLRNLPVSINRDGQVFLERQALAVDKLEEELRHLKRSSDDLNVLIQADRAVAFGTVARVMAAVQRAGISRLAFVTAPE